MTRPTRAVRLLLSRRDGALTRRRGETAALLAPARRDGAALTR